MPYAPALSLVTEHAAEDSSACTKFLAEVNFLISSALFSGDAPQSWPVLRHHSSPTPTWDGNGTAQSRAYLFRTPPGPSLYLRKSGTELIRSDGHDDHLTSFVLRSRMQHLSRFADYGALLRILQGRRGPAAMS